MRRLRLTQGKYTTVDDEFYEAVSQFSWHATKKGNQWYACRTERKDGRKKRVYLHRYVMSLAIDDDLIMEEYVDHVNGRGLDNRLENLRISTPQQNACNKKSKNGYKGVSRQGDKYLARLTYKGKTYYLGTYKTARAAAESYDKAAVRYHKEYARLNFG